MSDRDAMYQQIILDAARERHGAGALDDFDGESFQVNPTCGDQVNMQVKLSADGSHIEAIGWEGHGCSISQASLYTRLEVRASNTSTMLKIRPVRLISSPLSPRG